MTRPLKVLQVGPLPPPVGGMGTVITNLHEALQPACAMRVLNNRKSTAPDRSLYQGVAAQLRLLGRLLREVVSWGPDLVHIHTCSRFTFWRNGIDVALARLLRRRVVLHIHGAEFATFLDSLSPMRARAARWILARCHRVVVLGQDWKRLLDAWTAPERVVVVPNGVPVEDLRERDDDAPFTIVCLANYERRKGQRDLLDAVAQLRSERPVHVALLGFESETGQQKALLDQTARLGLGAQVEIPGPVMGEAKDAWWRRANCFCLPSYDEGLPMAMLEAMAHGLPVVLTRVGAIPEAVEHPREGLLYEAGDIPGLSAHLQALLDDPEQARTIGTAGRERVIAQFSLSRSAQLLLDLYPDLHPQPSG